MWINSQYVARFLGVTDRAIQKSALKANSYNKKFCTIKSNKLNFIYTLGKGRGGKILKIWLDDEKLVNDLRARAVLVGFDEGLEFLIARGVVCALASKNAELNTDAMSADLVSVGTTRANLANADLSSSVSEQISASRSNEDALDHSKPSVQNAGAPNVDLVSAGVGGAGVIGANAMSADLVSVGTTPANLASADLSSSVSEQISASFQSVRGADLGVCQSAKNVSADPNVQSRGVDLVSVSAGDGFNASASLAGSVRLSDKKRRDAFFKYDILREWNSARGKLTLAQFLDYINAKLGAGVAGARVGDFALSVRIDNASATNSTNKQAVQKARGRAQKAQNKRAGTYSGRITANKLFAWQKKYAAGGLDALVDARSSNKEQTLKRLGLEPFCVQLIHSQKGRISVANIYKALNYHAIKENKLSLDGFVGKKDEHVSYGVVYKYVSKYLKENKLVKDLILYGEDGSVSRHMPGLGVSNWAVDSINQIVEIDASPLDLICNASDLASAVGYDTVSGFFASEAEFVEYLKNWQKRYTIISLIDTYSGVATFHIADSENSFGIVRAIAKYILRFGVPKVIKGDNGKAFKSEYIANVLKTLNIEYRAVRAYSGWLKPYVERNFRSLQHSFTSQLAGFIGHNVTQRQAIEFFFSKKERRLKKGFKTNLKRLKSLVEIQELMDLYVEKFLNNRYMDRLQTTCRQAYEAKMHEAITIDEIALSARLTPKQERTVSKKGISLDGVQYYSSALFAYEKIWANSNINNINECFLWDADNNFVGVASTFDVLGVSADEARAANKIFNKRLKETKKQIDTSRVQTQEFFTDLVRNVAAKATPKPAQKQTSEDVAISASLASNKSIIDKEAVRAAKAAHSAKRPAKTEDLWLKAARKARAVS